MAAIETDALTKYYGDVRGIEDVSLTVERGEVFGYLGPNGAGKSTTIETLLGFLHPTSGAATVLGYDVREEAEALAARERIGYLPDSPAFPADRTGAELLAHHARLRGDERSDELLELFEPPLDRPVGDYSRGNRQKLAVVLAFMHDPDLAVMDEPTSGLDPLLQERFYEFLERETATGTTVFFSSHILGEVRRVCDRVGIVREGHLVEVAGVEELLERSGTVVRLRTPEPLAPARVDLEGVHDLATDEVTTFTYTGEVDALVDWLAGLDVLDLEITEAPLEDVFMRFYGEGAGDGRADGDGSREATGPKGASGPTAAVEGGDSS